MRDKEGQVDCDYWRSVVARLYSPSRRNWATHVLATGLSTHYDFENEYRSYSPPERDTNLWAALRCSPRQEIIEGTIRSYDDWSCQPSCDMILASFDPGEVVSVFDSIVNPSPKMKVGFVWFLEDVDKIRAKDLAASLIESETSNEVIYNLRLVLDEG